MLIRLRHRSNGAPRAEPARSGATSPGRLLKKGGPALFRLGSITPSR
jgi:hypothetical protein